MQNVFNSRGGRGKNRAGAASTTLPRRYLAWRQEWTLNVPFMDADHRILAGELNRIARDFDRSIAWKSGPGAERLLARLEYLGELNRRHFLREEQVMRLAEYPNAGAHQVEHKTLLHEYKDLVGGIRASGPAMLMPDTFAALRQWFVGHVLDEDRRFALFLRRCGLSATTPRDPLIAGDAADDVGPRVGEADPV